MSRWWALFQRFDIIDPEDGGLYLRRYRIVQTPWFGVYVHRIARPDKDRDLHDHPWPFVSMVLRGGYDEVRPADRYAFAAEASRRRDGFRPEGLTLGSWETVSPRRWLSIAFRRRYDAHRISRLHRAPTWTLVVVGRRRGSWGFYTINGWVDWRQYLGVDESPAAGGGA